MAYIYHGTVEKNIKPICERGLLPWNRSGQRVWHQWYTKYEDGSFDDELFGSRENLIYFYEDEDEAVQYVNSASEVYAYKELFPRRKAHTLYNFSKKYPELREKILQHLQRHPELNGALCRVDIDKLPGNCHVIDDPESGHHGRVAIAGCDVPPKLIECRPEGTISEHYADWKKCKV